MNQRVRRLTGSVLVVAIAGLLVAPPCMAEPVATAAAPRSLTALSPASLQILNAAPAPSRTQEGTPGAPGGFFKTRRGAVALALIAAGIGFTVWSAFDSRDPVKSPIR